MSDGPAPDLLDLMAEALTTTFTGHPQRRFQALAANRVLAERAWPPVQAALEFRDVQITGLVGICEQYRADIRTYQAEVERLTERIPYREGETEVQYLERQVARWRSEAWQARGKLRRAEAERDKFKAGVDQVRRLCDLTIAVSIRRDAIDQAQDTLGVLARSDLPAVREFAAEHDPRKES